MNDRLKLELKKYFKRIDSRDRYVKKMLDKTMFPAENWDSKIKDRTHLLVKEILEQRNFNFDKGRNKHKDRIRWNDEEKRIELRRFRCHNYYNVELFHRNYEDDRALSLLPEKFSKVLEKIQKYIESVDKLDDDKDINIKFKKILSVLSDRGKSVDKYDINEIYLGGDSIYINDDDIEYHKQVLYDEDVFLQVLKLLKARQEKYKKQKEKLEKGITRMLNYLGDENQWKKTIVKARLLDGTKNEQKDR